MEKCQRSGCNSEALPEHPCPFSEDIHNDSETLCNCCNNCIAECCDEI